MNREEFELISKVIETGNIAKIQETIILEGDFLKLKDLHILRERLDSKVESFVFLDAEHPNKLNLIRDPNVILFLGEDKLIEIFRRHLIIEDDNRRRVNWEIIKNIEAIYYEAPEILKQIDCPDKELKLKKIEELGRKAIDLIKPIFIELMDDKEFRIDLDGHKVIYNLYFFIGKKAVIEALKTMRACKGIILYGDSYYIESNLGDDINIGLGSDDYDYQKLSERVFMNFFNIFKNIISKKDVEFSWFDRIFSILGPTYYGHKKNFILQYLDELLNQEKKRFIELIQEADYIFKNRNSIKFAHSIAKHFKIEIDIEDKFSDEKKEPWTPEFFYSSEINVCKRCGKKRWTSECYRCKVWICKACEEDHINEYHTEICEEDISFSNNIEVFKVKFYENGLWECTCPTWVNTKEDCDHIAQYKSHFFDPSFIPDSYDHYDEYSDLEPQMFKFSELIKEYPRWILKYLFDKWRRSCSKSQLAEILDTSVYMINKLLKKIDEFQENRINSIYRDVESNLQNKDLEILWLPTEATFGELTSLPEIPEDVKSIKFINLEGNRLESLPSSIGNFTAVEKIQLRFNKLRYLPEAIGKLITLKKLYMQYNQLRELPESFGNLTQLEKLKLNNNIIRILPESFGNLKSLKYLNLSNNKLIRLPDSFHNLKSLEYLNLSSNKNLYIEHLMEFFKELKDKGAKIKY
ncbi:MAG: leucine-rich repeat domain-containing protein [Promethearchaeota archaeon]|nr:MAG: leucine-rich repeat domain-containing protein [Candidatus Lokiarchaeota archaeon]